MFGPSDVDDYLNAESQTGRRNPLVPVRLLSRRMEQATRGQFLAYSIIPVTAQGELATDGASTAYLGMPHVFARTRAGCGQWNTPKAKLAKLTSAGFANAPDRASAAEEILKRIIAVYGLPNGSSNGGNAAEPPGPRTPAEPMQTVAEMPQFAARREPIGVARDEGPARFFERIRGQVAAAFAKSDVYVRQREIGKQWNYSICGLPLVPGNPLLLGLNWGANPSVAHAAQITMPGDEAYAEVANYRFVARSAALLRRHVGDIQSLNYLNVLPFRSPDIQALTRRDWELGINAFFFETVDYLRPPVTVVLGTSAVSELAAHMNLRCDTIAVSDGGRQARAYVGTMATKRDSYKFVALPHPNNALTSGARAELWAQAFGVAGLAGRRDS